MSEAKEKFKQAIQERNYPEALSMFHDFGDESYVRDLLCIIDNLEDQKMSAQGDLLRVIAVLKNKLKEYEEQDGETGEMINFEDMQRILNAKHVFQYVKDNIKALEEPLHSAFEKAMVDPELNPGAVSQEDCGEEFKFDMPEGFRYTGKNPPEPIKGSTYIDIDDQCEYEYDGYNWVKISKGEKMKENIEKAINALSGTLSENFSIEFNGSWAAEVCQSILSLTQAYEILNAIGDKEKQ